ncbi:MAG: alpha/beta fold hydrolase [Pseudonocardia sp.]
MTTSTAPSPITARDVEVAGHRLHLNETGDPSAPAILWLHGSGPGVTALTNWQALITRLAPRFHNLAPDVLGFGESAHPDPAPAGMAAYTAVRARVLLDLLDVLGLQRVHLVGNSMGGMIALRMVLDAPERVDRLVLMGSGGAPLAPTPDLLRMIRFYEDPTGAAMRELLPRFVHDPALFAGRLEEIAATRLATASRPEVRRSHLATFDPAGEPVRYTPEELARIEQQALVVHGREDRFIPVHAGYFLAEHIRNAQLHVLPNTGHWAQLEQPERFRAQVELFLGEPASAEGEPPA